MAKIQNFTFNDFESSKPNTRFEINCGFCNGLNKEQCIDSIIYFLSCRPNSKLYILNSLGCILPAGYYEREIYYTLPISKGVILLITTESSENDSFNIKLIVMDLDSKKIESSLVHARYMESLMQDWEPKLAPNLEEQIKTGKISKD